jgi:Holliday junction resolvase RusA-like endonuclease
MGYSFFIPGNVPSSKNSKRIVRHGNKTLIIHSKITMDYIKRSENAWIISGQFFRNTAFNFKRPLRIEFEFIRDSRRKFDYINPAQTVQDLMVKYGWIDDDNCDEIIPIFLPYKYDKKNPGVNIYISEHINNE